MFLCDAGWCGIPRRSDNRFRLLVDGPQFFPAMIEAIERAERRIDLELIWWRTAIVWNACSVPPLRAAERGVRVRCLFDGFGCLKMSQANRDRMTAAGVELRLYNPLSLRLKLRNLHRDHRKLLLVDGCVGFVGGTGITDDFWNPRACGALARGDGRDVRPAVAGLAGAVRQPMGALPEATDLAVAAAEPRTAHSACA